MDYSVITICLNSERTIQRTIDSVFAQSRLPRQYLFVDGGSSDSTVRTIDACAANTAVGLLGMDVAVIPQRSGDGIAGAWNLGLKRALGDVIFILNSDDWYGADCAERVMMHFESDLLTDMVVGSTRLCSSSDGGMVRHYRTKPFPLFPFLNPINHPACFVRRRVYERLGLYNPDYKVAADYDFLYRCRKARVVIRKDNDIVVNREAGGYAERNRVISRGELNRIAKKYCGLRLLPDLAYFARRIADR
jgi:glycosyltransferase involved in cell wall biosynthesis